MHAVPQANLQYSPRTLLSGGMARQNSLDPTTKPDSSVSVSCVGRAGAPEPNGAATEAAEGLPDTSSVLLAVGESFPPGKRLPLASPRFPVAARTRPGIVAEQALPSLGLLEGKDGICPCSWSTQPGWRQPHQCCGAPSPLTLHLSSPRDFALLLRGEPLLPVPQFPAAGSRQEEAVGPGER